MCGYYNLVVNQDQSLTEYYQVYYGDDFYYTPSWIRNIAGISRINLGSATRAVSKGFIYVADTFLISPQDSIAYDSIVYILKTKQPSSKVNSYMAKLEYQLADVVYDHYFLYVKNFDTVAISKELDVKNDSTFVYSNAFLQFKPQSQNYIEYLDSTSPVLPFDYE